MPAPYTFTSAGGGSSSDASNALANFLNKQNAAGTMPGNPYSIQPIKTLGGITGYTGYGQPGGATSYNADGTLNYGGGNGLYGSGIYSNLYGAGNSPLYNPLTNSYNSQTGGAPMWNGSSWVTSTGQPYTGTYNGQTFNLGQSYQQMANDPTSRYQSVSVVKDPGVASATDSMISGFQPTQGITNFSDLLNASRTASSTATAGLASDQNAYNIQPFADTMNSLNANQSQIGSNLNSTYSGLLNNQAGAENSIVNQASGLLPQQYQTLQGINNQFANTAGGLNTNYSNILGNTAGNENSLVNQAYQFNPQQLSALQGITGQFANTAGQLNQNYSDTLSNLQNQENQDVTQANQNLTGYDTAAQAVADQEQQALGAQVSRYKLGTGTPASLGGGEEAMLLQGTQNIQLPTQLAKVQAQQNLLTNYQTPLQQQMAQSQIGQINYATPLAQQIYGQNYGAQQGYNAQQNNILQNMQLPLAQQQGAAAVNQLTNYTTPLAQQIYGQNYNTQQGFNQAQQNMLQNIQLPLATQQGNRAVQQLTNFTAPQAQQDYTNAATTAQTVKNLQLQTAGMAIQDATNYLKAMAVPDQIIQQILSTNQSLQGGNISNLSGLNSLYSGSRYQGLQDNIGANLSQPTVSTFSPPGGARGYPTGGGVPQNSYYYNFGGQQNQPGQAGPMSTMGTATAPNPGNISGGQYLSGMNDQQLAQMNLVSIGGGMFADNLGNLYGPDGNPIQNQPQANAMSPQTASADAISSY